VFDSLYRFENISDGAKMLSQGSIFENCRILEEIGSGGTGIIYKAYHLRLQKYVVLKKIKQSVAEKVNIRAEVDILKNVKHSYLPQVYDFIEYQGDIYTVIDYIEGYSLQYFLDQNRRFSQPMLVKWAIQLCEALEYLHSRTPGIIHSDIKPGNIMITPQGDVCLIDFNISLQSDRMSRLYGISRAYASPEQCAIAMDMTGNANPAALSSSGFFQRTSPYSAYKMIDTRSDIYSLGATFYHLMTGVRPNTAVDGNVPVNQLELPYSDALADIIAKAMEPELDKRYQSATAMLKSLKNIVKLDDRYKKITKSRRAVDILFSFLIVAFTLLSITGYSTMQKQKDTQYSRLIAEGEALCSDGAFDSALDKFMEARNLRPNDIKSHYEEVELYWLSADYDKAITFGKDLLNNSDLRETLKSETEMFAFVNYFIGDSYFYRQDYASAITYYEDALQADNQNPDFYRDLAISYARAGQTQQAESTLKKAEASGMQSDSLLLVSGELKKANNDNEGAAADFEKVLATTRDEKIRLRVVLLLSDVYKKTQQPDKQIQTLESARQTIPAEQLAPVLQELAAAYSLKAQQNPQQKALYEKKSLDTYLILYQNGNPGQTLLLNIANLYQRLGDYANAEKYLTQAQSVDSGNYKVYLRFALLEAQKQGTYSEAGRDYRKCKEYYDKASALYEPERNKGVSDPEMAQLESVIDQLKQGGWLN